jgi:hypothetical protein
MPGGRSPTIIPPARPFTFKSSTMCLCISKRSGVYEERDSSGFAAWATTLAAGAVAGPDDFAGAVVRVTLSPAPAPRRQPNTSGATGIIGTVRNTEHSALRFGGHLLSLTSRKATVRSAESGHVSTKSFSGGISTSTWNQVLGHRFPRCGRPTPPCVIICSCVSAKI